MLVGTDVSLLSDFFAAASRVPTDGAYSSEQGGAVAHVRLESGPKGQTLTRDFAEPGTKRQTKRYDALQGRADGMRLSGKDLEMRTRPPVAPGD